MKSAHMPDSLFKYRSCNDHSFEALKNDFLFSAQPREFNDIFEGAIEIVNLDATKNIFQKTYDNLRKEYPFLIDRQVASDKDILECVALSFGGSYEDVKDNCKDFPLMQAMGNAMKADITKTISRLQDNARNMYNVCCFCAENDNKTMWAHYADSHRGFCVAYGIKELDNDLTHLTFPVIYRYNCQLCIGDIDNIDGNICMHMLTVKSLDWCMEREWRTFFPANPPIHKEQMPIAKAVFLGAHIEPKNEKRLREICVPKGISLFKMIPITSQLKLVAEPLYN